MATATQVVVVLHTLPIARAFKNGVQHGVVHNEKTPFAVVLWDTAAKKVAKIVKRYVTVEGALVASKRIVL
jgi:ribosomal protein L7/L12